MYIRTVVVSALLASWAAVQASPTQLQDSLAAKEASSSSSSGGPGPQTKTFISISPEPCTAASGASGTCRSSSDCSTRGETADGRCALWGLGVCCVAGGSNLKCESTTTALLSNFVNRNYPNVDSAAIGSCRTTIKVQSNICQLRIDLLDFTLSQPNGDGKCATDYLTVTGGSPVPKICGENAGQHMYVDVTGGSNVVIDAVTQSAGSRWKIKTTQIPCASSDQAPAGCLQYFTDTTGTISSFNFNNAATSTSTGTRQLANQVYGICIKSQPGYCSITYRQTPNTVFSLTGDRDALDPALPPLALVGTDCTTDYLIIPGGGGFNVAMGEAGTPVTSADRFCGFAFPDVTSQVQPFNVFLVTDGTELTDPSDGNNQGFKITYRMNPCGTPGG